MNYLYKTAWLLPFVLGCILLASCDTPRPSSHPAVSATRALQTAYTEPHRPQFHFSPAAKWMNDPNGLVYYQGEYHLFYQYYPDSTVWGPMHWAHAVSTDLVHWEHLPVALYPDEKGYIFSGSAVVDWGNTSGFGKDGQPPLIAMFTYHDPAAEKTGIQAYQSQAIAYSLDRGRSWTKYAGNPVIPNPGNARDFRDPKLVWDAERRQWVVALAVADHAEFWTSYDLKNWTKRSEFGRTLGNHGGVWECPDLFPITVEGSGEKMWVLLQNINPGHPNGGSGTQYFVGKFDGTTFNLDPGFLPYVQGGKAVWLDDGKDNYAGVTWSDVPASDGRRLFIGWMSNWEYANKVPTGVWRNATTIPCSLTLHHTGAGYRIFREPVRAFQILRGARYALHKTVLSTNLDLTDSLGFVPTLSELELEFDLAEGQKGKFGVELSNSTGEQYRIGFDAAANQFFSDRTKAGDASFSPDFAKQVSVAARQSKDKKLRLHLFFDAASVEMFADGGATGMTEIFFPSEDFHRMKLFIDGSPGLTVEGNVYRLNRIWR